MPDAEPVGGRQHPGHLVQAVQEALGRQRVRRRQPHRAGVHRALGVQHARLDPAPAAVDDQGPAHGGAVCRPGAGVGAPATVAYRGISVVTGGPLAAQTPVARPRTPRRALIAAAAMTAGLVLVLTALHVGRHAGRRSATGPGSPSASPSPEPTLAIARTVPFDQPATFSVTNGTLESAVVKGHVHGTPLAGTVQSDGTSWVSDELPTPSASYDVSAQVRAAGRPVAHADRPARRRDPRRQGPSRLHGDPVQRLDGRRQRADRHPLRQAGQDQAAVEQRLTVATTTPLVGSWHWVNTSRGALPPAGRLAGALAGAGRRAAGRREDRHVAVGRHGHDGAALGRRRAPDEGRRQEAHAHRGGERQDLGGVADQPGPAGVRDPHRQLHGAAQAADPADDVVQRGHHLLEVEPELLRPHRELGRPADLQRDVHPLRALVGAQPGRRQRLARVHQPQPRARAGVLQPRASTATSSWSPGPTAGRRTCWPPATPGWRTGTRRSPPYAAASALGGPITTQPLA